ncbi:hypothetical protein Mapa_000034 [Marchantia paleacea]|nr:hypothetical protein Mapa_000034 [Marchantia paleacea]
MIIAAGGLSCGGLGCSCSLVSSCGCIFAQEEQPRSFRGQRGSIGQRSRDEIGASISASENLSGFIISTSGVLSRVESAQPQAYLLRGVLNFRYPSPRRPLPHAHETLLVLLDSPFCSRGTSSNSPSPV